MKRVTPLLSGHVLILTLATIARSEEPERPRPKRVGIGQLSLLKVEERSITVKLVPTTTGGATEQTVAIDREKTRVRISEPTDQRENTDGTVTVRYKLRPGNFTDLKAGQKVIVMAVGDLATEIQIVMAPPPPAKK